MAYDTVLRQSHTLTSPNLVEGMILFLLRSRTYPNISGATAQVQTITPGVATQEITVYRLREQTTGQTVTFTSDATPTAAEVVTGLLAALRANPVLNGLAVFSGTTTVIATSRQAGTSATQLDFVDGGSTPTNVLTVANTTAAADPGIIQVGRGVTIGVSDRIGLSTGALSSTNVFRGIIGLDHTDSFSQNYPGSPSGLYSFPRLPQLVLEQGEIVVRNLDAVDPTKPVFMVHSGANSGLFAGSGIANTSQISTGAAWRSSAPANSLAILSLNLP